MLTIEFRTDLGATVHVKMSGPEQLLETQRQYGRLGWTSGEIPAGGYQLPFDNADDFDWSLIGARKWTTPDGEVVIIHRGHSYKRRDLEAVDSRKMKLPAAIKFSRGAKSTDPEHVRERSDGEFDYVTLAIFRGGKRQARYALPQQPAAANAEGAATARPPAPRPVPARAGLPPRPGPATPPVR